MALPHSRRPQRIRPTPIWWSRPLDLEGFGSHGDGGVPPSSVPSSAGLGLPRPRRPSAMLLAVDLRGHLTAWRWRPLVPRARLLLRRHGRCTRDLVSTPRPFVLPCRPAMLC